MQDAPAHTQMGARMAASGSSAPTEVLGSSVLTGALGSSVIAALTAPLEPLLAGTPAALLPVLGAEVSQVLLAAVGAQVLLAAASAQAGMAATGDSRAFFLRAVSIDGRARSRSGLRGLSPPDVSDCLLGKGCGLNTATLCCLCARQGAGAWSVRVL